MEAAEALRRLGGLGTAAVLTQLSSRRAVNRALQAGSIRRVARGKYVLAEADRDRVVATQIGGVLSHLSAAMAHGWELKHPPDKPWISVPRGRRLSYGARGSRHVKYVDLGHHELATGVTSPVRTVIDCARFLPFDEALAVADSALRSLDVSRRALERAAEEVKGKGAAQARRVAAEADGRAANPFESVLRALVLESGVLKVEPQAAVVAGGRLWHPDLVDREHSVVLEADSWTFHATREAHGRDCLRYNALTLAGWLVLRFTWEQVMLSPAYVLDVLRQLSSGPPRRTNRRANAA